MPPNSLAMPVALGQKLAQKKPGQKTSTTGGKGGTHYTHFTQTEINLATKWRNEGKSLIFKGVAWAGGSARF